MQLLSTHSAGAPTRVGCCLSDMNNQSTERQTEGDRKKADNRQLKPASYLQIVLRLMNYFPKTNQLGLFQEIKAEKIAMKDAMGFGPLVNICTFFMAQPESRII